MKNLTIAGIILVPFVLLLSCFALVVYNPDFQANLLEKHSQHPELGKKINTQLIEYFKSDSMDPAPIKEFTEAENKHMLDVKIAINRAIRYWLILSAIFLAVLYFSNEKRKIFMIGGPLTAIPFLIYELVPFDSLFERMHMALFEFGTWVFPPESLMVQVYPNEFFYWITFSVATAALILGLGSAFIAWLSKQ